MTSSAVSASRLVVLAVLTLAPGRAGAAEATESGAVTPALACRPELPARRSTMDADEPGDHPTDLEVKVGDRLVRLDALEDVVPERLTVFPADATSVLVAVVYNDGQQGEPHGSDSLWQVPCKQPGAARKLVHATDADFGHSALFGNGRTLYYTGGSGVFALDLAQWKSRRITRASLAYCTQNSIQARDVVRELAPDGTLFVDRGCGYMLGWYGRRFRVTQLDTDKPVAVRDPYRMLATVAIDGAGAIWLSDGECEDDGTNNRLLYSLDRGQHWREIHVRGQRNVPFVNQPVGTILTGKRDTKTVVVFQRSCLVSDSHVEAAWAYVTPNGGASFRPIAPPPDIELASDGRQPAPETDPLAGIAAPGDSLAELVLFSSSDEVGPWRSRNLGRSWQRMARKSPPSRRPPAPSRSASFGDWHVTIEHESLFLSIDGQAGRRRIYPLQEAPEVKLPPP